MTKVDLGIILDSSGSLSKDYDKEKDFLKELASSFGVSDDGSRVGVVTFSSNSEHSIKLKDHVDFVSFNNAVDKIPLMGSTTRIDKAFRLSQNELLSVSNGARPGVPKILVLLTDGSQTPEIGSEDPGDIADEIRKSGIKMIVVGVGQGIDKKELVDIAGGQDSVFLAKSFNQLISVPFVEKFLDKSCKKGWYITFQP